MRRLSFAPSGLRRTDQRGARRAGRHAAIQPGTGCIGRSFAHDPLRDTLQFVRPWRAILGDAGGNHGVKRRILHDHSAVQGIVGARTLPFDPRHAPGAAFDPEGDGRQQGED